MEHKTKAWLNSSRAAQTSRGITALEGCSMTDIRMYYRWRRVYYLMDFNYIHMWLDEDFDNTSNVGHYGDAQ